MAVTLAQRFPAGLRPAAQSHPPMQALAIPWLDDPTPLPATRAALGPDTEAPGLLAAGGQLGTRRLEEAYRKGVFPWYAPGQPVLWWSPDPRMVLPVAEFKLARSLRKLRASGRVTLTDAELSALGTAVGRGA